MDITTYRRRTSARILADREHLPGVRPPEGSGNLRRWAHSGLLTYAAALGGQVASMVDAACWRGGSCAGKPAVSEDAGAWAHCQ
jgi:hypothetical protein